MGNSGKKKQDQPTNKIENDEEFAIQFDVNLDDESDGVEVERSSVKKERTSSIKVAPKQAEIQNNEEEDFIGLDLSDVVDENPFNEGTQKTIIIDRKALQGMKTESIKVSEAQEAAEDSKELLAELSESDDFSLGGTNPTIQISEPSLKRAHSTDTGTKIEATIKDILNPNLGSSSEHTDAGINLSELEGSGPTIPNVSEIEDSELTFGEKTASGEYALSESAQEMFAKENSEEAELDLGETELQNQTTTKDGLEIPSFDSSLGDIEISGKSALSLDSNNSEGSGSFELEGDGRTTEFKFDRPSSKSNTSSNETFDLSAEDLEDAAEEQISETEDIFSESTEDDVLSKIASQEDNGESVIPSTATGGYTHQHKEDMDILARNAGEDSLRFQATIRALREEREDLFTQVKAMKAALKESEQDNLTLRANLDEAKIEVTILRKRHQGEIEELRHQAALNEEKRLFAEERAKQAEAKREKLEQKVRIDFNQVKQREKELESKLELLSMDVDSQVQSRDHKILELRRKIDALEFNMENASIKEQKSHEDKRKLEDRLSKVMKTLRQSIKNLEEDMQQQAETILKEKN